MLLECSHICIAALVHDLAHDTLLWTLLEGRCHGCFYTGLVQGTPPTLGARGSLQGKRDLHSGHQIRSLGHRQHEQLAVCAVLGADAHALHSTG